MAESITLKTVAKHAGVSYHTVSKVVRNYGQISRAARQRSQQSIAAQQALAIPESSCSTATVMVADTIAGGAMQAVETCGLIIGRDIAVPGFDDMPTTRHLKPGPTPIRQPIGEGARAVLSLLLAQLNGEQSAIQPLMLSPELVVRASSQGYGRVDHEKGALSTVPA